ncbi:MAG: hypothetical protein IPH94_10165 [Saprospiraceae bacterium]|nr:hypothetical protein [Saprospiraceae bacterium]
MNVGDGRTPSVTQLQADIDAGANLVNRQVLLLPRCRANTTQLPHSAQSPSLTIAKDQTGA